jgi:mono/diheme cytochrome c family protein
LFNAILLGGTFVVLYLYISFTTPVKSPPPDRRPIPVVTKATDQPLKIKQVPKAEVATAEPQGSGDPILDKGQKVYLANCISCHNKDPNIKGAVGPEIVDAPMEVMMHKVVTGRYPDKLPAGFVPKRDTKLMRKFPKLEADVSAIHAWVQSVRRK